MRALFWITSDDYQFKSNKLKSQTALAICHNVTPTYESDSTSTSNVNNTLDKNDNKHIGDRGCLTNLTKKEKYGETSFSKTPPPMNQQQRNYQASSPDEIALVKWTESVGLTLVDRSLDMIKLQTAGGYILEYQILQVGDVYVLL